MLDPRPRLFLLFQSSIYFIIFIINIYECFFIILVSPLRLGRNRRSPCPLEVLLDESSQRTS